MNPLLVPDGSNLWVPGTGSRNDYSQIHYLSDIGIYVSSSNLFYALRSRLRSYPIEDFLALVSRVSFLRAGDRTEDLSEVIRKQGAQPEVALREYQMAFLVALLLHDYDWAAERRWKHDSPKWMFRQLLECTRMVGGILPVADKPLETDEYNDAAEILLRIAFQQFVEFEGVGPYIPRYMLIYGECAKLPEAQQHISLSEILRKKVGLDIAEVLFLALALFALLYKGKRGHLVQPAALTSSPDLPGVNPEQVQCFFDWLSIPYEEFAAQSRTHELAAPKGYEPYYLNPLVEFPILHTPSCQYVIPIVTYLLQRVTMGLFYDLIRSEKGGAAGDIIGKSFELYISRLVQDLPSCPDLIPEQHYEASKTTCEWILPEAEALVLIECKRFSVKQNAKTTGDRSTIKTDLAREGGVADGIAKLIETAHAIRRGQVRGVPTDRLIRCFLITLDRFYLGNTRFIRGIINELIAQRGIEPPADFDYQICSVSDFEELCALLCFNGQSLSWALIDKIEGKHNVRGDRPTYEWDVSAWVSAVRPEGATLRIPCHDEVYEKQLAPLLERFQMRAGDDA